MKRRRYLLWMQTLMACLFLSSAFTFAQEPKPTRGGTLRVGWVTTGKTMDLHKSVQWAERHVLYCIYDNLVGLDESFNVVPQLATSWENPDKMTYVFNLRRGVKFHDGTDFDASVVKWNIDRLFEPEFASPQKQLIDQVTSVEVLDKYKVAFRLKKPFAPLLAALADMAGFIVSPSAVKKYGDQKFAMNPVGTGPFMFENWMPQVQLNVKRFDNYWGKDQGKPYLDRIEFREIADPLVRQTMLKSGELDFITDIDTKEALDLQKEKFRLIKTSPPLRWLALQWQVDKLPFNNRALREAIACGIDREAINKALYYGEAMAASGPVVPGLWWYEKDFKGYSYNPELAKKKLAEAGYPNGISFRFTVINQQSFVQLAEILQSQLEKIGVKMEFEMVNRTESYARVLAGKTNWTMTNWAQRADPNGLLAILFHTNGLGNSTKYDNPTVDKLLDEGAGMYNISERKKIYHEAVRTITMDAPYVFLLYFPDWAGMSPKVHGYKWIPDAIPRFSFLWKEQ